MLSRATGEGWVIIEGLGPPPRTMDEEVRWTVEGFARIDRALVGHPGLKDLEAAYRRLRERNPACPSRRARELALLGTRAREDGTLEWKFDGMLATLGVDGPFALEYVMAVWRRIAAPTLVVQGAESGRVLARHTGRDLPRARRPLDGASRASGMRASSRSRAPGTWCTSIVPGSCCGRCATSCSRAAPREALRKSLDVVKEERVER